MLRQETESQTSERRLGAEQRFRTEPPSACFQETRRLETPEICAGYGEEYGEEAVLRQAGQRRQRLRRRLRPTGRAGGLNRRQRFLMGGVPLLYAAFMFFTVLSVRHPPEAMVALQCFILPQVLALLVGLMLARKRLGAAAGLLLNACTIAGVVIAVRVTEGITQPSPRDLQIITSMLVGGTFIGAVGAGMRQGISWLQGE